MGVETVDPDDERLVAPIDIADRLGDVLPRLCLQIGRNRILEIKKDDVGVRLRRLFEELRRTAGHRKLGAVQTLGAGLDIVKAQR